VIEFITKHPELALALIPGLPLAACTFIGVFGRWLKGAAHVPAVLAMVGSLCIALALVVGLTNGSLSPLKDVSIYDWIMAGSLQVNVAFTVDQLTALYLSFITGIGLLIFIYAAGYMKGDEGYWRFFAYLSIFVFFMCVLVMANNFILLYLGWEGVGLASYLLIGFYYPRPAAVAAAKKAFIVNRIGDFGLLIGIFLLYSYFGTTEFTLIFEKMENDDALVRQFAPVLYFVPFCLMLGAFGKSAQFPLHVWLPDAMEGPTPVSALIHAATMVTAGVYLIARCMPIFGNTIIDPGHHALNVVACVGGFTAFLAATIAMCQYDLKRIWAYSTLSQLGYMFMGLGVAGGVAASSAVFHVFTHAFFKALLFLSAGSVMHAMGGELDIRKMSGIKKVMPITRITMLIGCVALAGLPFVGAGFFSKDEIIHHALNSSMAWLGWLGLGVALMTAYYTFRVYFRVFEGPLELPETAGHHEDERHASMPAKYDGSWLMWIPLLILCIGAIGAGYLGTQYTGDWIHNFLYSLRDTTEIEKSHPPAFTHSTMLMLAFIVSFTGIAIAFYFHKVNRHAAEIAANTAFLKPIVTVLRNKWYWDEIYDSLLVRPLRIFAIVLSIFDRYVIDGMVFIVGFVPQLIGYSLKPTQRGFLQQYAIGMIAGLVVVILLVCYFVFRGM